MSHQPFRGDCGKGEVNDESESSRNVASTTRKLEANDARFCKGLQGQI